MFPVNKHTTGLEYEAQVVVSAKGRTGRKVGADAVVRGVLSVSVCGSNTDLVDYWLHVAAVGITRRAYYPAAMCW